MNFLCNFGSGPEASTLEFFVLKEIFKGDSCWKMICPKMIFSNCERLYTQVRIFILMGPYEQPKHNFYSSLKVLGTHRLVTVPNV